MTTELAMGELPNLARTLESLNLAKINFTSACFTLGWLLDETFIRESPQPVDYHKRQELVRIFNLMAREIYATSSKVSPVVEEYGSFVMDMFNKKSDLDLSINFLDSTTVDRRKKISILRKFTKKLYSIQRTGHITSVLLVTTARVPIVKLTDRGTGIECDLSVENRDGISKSRIIHAISAIDERFRKLCFLMKSWGQAHKINSSKDGTLNSLSIVSLVAFHLQTCRPPILPPFSALLKEGADPASVINVVKNYLNYGKNNTESLARLFVTLFVKLASVEELWKEGLCVSLYMGSWTSKAWGGKRLCPISIEDFMDPAQNVARAVGAKQVETIYACIHASLFHLSEFLNGHMQGMELMGRLFGSQTVSTLGIGGPSNINENMINRTTLQGPVPSRKRHLEEGLLQNQVKKQALQGIEPHGMGGVQHVVGTSARNSEPASFTPVVPCQPPLAIPRPNFSVMGGVQHVGTSARNSEPASFTPVVPHQPPLAIPRPNFSDMGGVQHVVGTSARNSEPASFTPVVPRQPPLAIPRPNFSDMGGVQHVVGTSASNSEPASFTLVFPRQPPLAIPRPNFSDMGGVQHVVGTSACNSEPASFTPAVPCQPPRPNFSVHHHHNGYGPGTISSHHEGLHNLSKQAQPFPSQTFQGYVETPPQNPNVIAPTGNGAIRPHLPPAIHDPYRGDHTLYNHRRY